MAEPLSNLFICLLKRQRDVTAELLFIEFGGNLNI